MFQGLTSSAEQSTGKVIHWLLHLHKSVIENYSVHGSTIYNSQDMEATLVSINRGMDKEDVVHIYNGIRLSHKKEGSNAICSNMDGLGRHYAK